MNNPVRYIFSRSIVPRSMFNKRKIFLVDYKMYIISIKC